MSLHRLGFSSGSKLVKRFLDRNTEHTPVFGEKNG